MEISQSSEKDETDKETSGLTHDYLKECVEEFISMTNDARCLSERCRDYYDGKQWTPEQVAALKKRKQAPVVNNRIKVKQNGLLGLTSLRRGDPKAYPRNQGIDSDASEAVTDGLRYVADSQNLDSTFLEAADTFFCEGYTGINIITEENPRNEIDVIPDFLPWDRLIFDPFSRKHDFKDCRYKGFAVWMDEDDITTAFDEADEDALSSLAVETDETFQDKPRWSYKSGKRKRFLVITLYVKYQGVWFMTIFTGGGFLVEPFESPYLDEFQEPDCPIEIEHAYVDRENNRYGELASFLDLQDEINQRRSKALFLMSQRQTYGNRGAVKDIAKAKTELAKPDGHLEVGQGEYGKDFGVLPTGDMAQGQFELLQEAKAEMDAQSFGAQMAGQRQQGDLSGVALKRLEQSGVTELVKLFDNFSAFKLRVYRQIWNRIRHSWTEEKWIRVTDDEDKLRWVGFNIKITTEKFLTEIMEDESKPYEMRLGATASLMQLEKENPEGLQELVETRNRPVELDMDVILEEEYDTVNAGEEQLDAILKFGAQNAFDIVDLLEISNIRGKDKLIERIENRKAEAAKAQEGPTPEQQFFEAKAAEAAAGIAKKEAEAQKTIAETQEINADTVHQQIETELLINKPQLTYKTTVSI